MENIKFAKINGGSFSHQNSSSIHSKNRTILSKQNSMYIDYEMWNNKNCWKIVWMQEELRREFRRSEA